MMIIPTISGDEQIAALTQREPLPLSPVPKAILELIIDVVHDVWAQLRQAVPGLIGAEEPQITTRFQAEMLNWVEAQPFLTSLISSIVQSPNLPNFNGTKLAKQPDLAIYLRSRNPRFPLTFECKVIRYTKGRTVNLYGKEGIARFISGDYAWASQEAIMLAYVQDDSDLEDKLFPWLDDKECPTPSLPLSNTVKNIACGRNIASTSHRRGFEYRVSVGNKDPGPIILWHLWLDAR